MARARNFAITIWKPEEMSSFQKFVGERCNYWVYGREIAPSTGNVHIQAYMQFSNPQRFSTLKKIIPTAHLEESQAQNARAAAGYCKKGSCEQRPEGGWGEFFDSPHPTWEGEEGGTLKQQGKRTDLQQLAQQVLSGETTVNDIAREQPNSFHVYGRTLERLQDLHDRKRKRDWQTQGYWIHGPTGTGKTRAIQETFGSNVYWHEMDDKGWWDAYNGEEVVALDDFRGEISFGKLLRLADRYPCTVPRRGRQPLPFLAKVLVVTSPLPPEQIYTALPPGDSMDQLRRRFIVLEAQEGLVLPLPEHFCAKTSVPPEVDDNRGQIYDISTPELS